jgi:hypothetical protein
VASARAFVPSQADTRERTVHRQRRPIAGHRAVDDRGTLDPRLTGNPSDLAEVAGIDVISELRLRLPVERQPARRIEHHVRSLDLQPRDVGDLVLVLADEGRPRNLHAADERWRERDAAVGAERRRRERRRQIGDAERAVDNAADVAVDHFAIGQEPGIEMFEPAFGADGERLIGNPGGEAHLGKASPADRGLFQGAACLERQ